MKNVVKILIFLIILLGGIGAFVGLSLLKKPPPKKSEELLRSLIVIPLKAETFSPKVAEFAVVSTLEEISLKVQVSGKVTFCGEGTEDGVNVKKGDVIIEIEKDDYKIAKDQAEAELDILESKWNDKYPIVIKSWRSNWERLSQFFKYPEDIRRIIYTTNTIEAVHRQFRKLTKTKGAFPNQNSLLKLLYMGIQNASKKWTMPIQNWSLTISQLAIFFEDRLDKELKI